MSKIKIFAALTLGVAIGFVMGQLTAMPMTRWLAVVHHWQTLITGVMAILAAVITVCGLYYLDWRKEDNLENRRRDLVMHDIRMVAAQMEEAIDRFECLLNQTLYRGMRSKIDDKLLDNLAEHIGRANIQPVADVRRILGDVEDTSMVIAVDAASNIDFIKSGLDRATASKDWARKIIKGGKVGPIPVDGYFIHLDREE